MAMDESRVPAALAIQWLAAEAVRSGRPELVLKPATLRQWRARGHLSEGRGYVPLEIYNYITSRDRRTPPVPAATG